MLAMSPSFTVSISLPSNGFVTSKTRSVPSMNVLTYTLLSSGAMLMSTGSVPSPMFAMFLVSKVPSSFR